MGGWTKSYLIQTVLLDTQYLWFQRQDPQKYVQLSYYCWLLMRMGFSWFWNMDTKEKISSAQHGIERMPFFTFIWVHTPSSYFLCLVFQWLTCRSSRGIFWALSSLKFRQDWRRKIVAKVSATWLETQKILLSSLLKTG